MTEDITSLVASININQVSVPTLKFLEVKTNNKELVIDYDDTTSSFTFSLREIEVNEQQ